MRRIRLRVPTSVKCITTPIIGRIPVWIASGVNRGCTWSLASWGSGYGTGRREWAQMEMLRALMREGDIVWDVGAHYGFVTLLAASRAGGGGHVYAFEPSVANRWFLSRHLRWNHLRNVTIMPYAIGSFDGITSFGGGSTSKQHRIGGGAERVEVRTIPSLLSSGKVAAPTFLKIDVEGAEGGLLKAGCASLASNTRMVVAVHSRGAYEECWQALSAGRFRLYESSRLERYRREGWHGDADLIAFGPEYQEYERDIEALAASGI